MIELILREETLFKVADALRRAGLSEQQVADCITDMQNNGLYFREAKPADEPNLGLATTQQLLEEIKARGEVEHYYVQLGSEMAIGAYNLLDSLPGSMLEYRTVDPL